MYFTFGSSVCKHKRIRAHILHTRIHRFSQNDYRQIRVDYPEFDNTLATPHLRHYSHVVRAAVVAWLSSSSITKRVIFMVTKPPIRAAQSASKRGVGVSEGVSCHGIIRSATWLLTTSRLAGPDSCRQPGSLGH